MCLINGVQDGDDRTVKNVTRQNSSHRKKNKDGVVCCQFKLKI